MKPILIAALALAVAGCAPTVDTHGDTRAEAARSPRACFDVDRVRNFRPGDRMGDVYVRSGGRDQSVFLLSSMGGCWDLDTTPQIGLRTNGFAGTRACEGDSVQIITPDGPGSRPDVCRAHVVKVLTEAEVNALPARDRP